MAKLAAVQHQHYPPSSLSLLSSSFSDFSGTRLHACIQYKRKVWQPKGALCVTASSTEKILIMGGTRFIRVFLSRLLTKIGHQITLFTRVEAPIIQQLPGELDQVHADFSSKTKAFAVPRRSVMALILSSCIFLRVGLGNIALAQPSVAFREYIDTFDGYSFKYPQNWVQVRGAGADIFFRDPYVLDENLSVEFSSPSSSSYKSVEDLGPPEEAGKKVLKQYLTEFMSTRLGVRRESNVVSTSSRIADDGKMYYQVEVNIKSYANNNELAVMPQDRVVRLEWDRRYLSVLGVENSRLYELRIQTPENVFLEEENEIRQVMDSFRVNMVTS
ncbi:psbP domain-containing protein 1, chloroplastic isoform X1 [Eucalyptus grandis]|uniref:psbP domain-containing protein 1, chloroplastic isoform X1 n=1 Tax=Eucalyptus grandis TaxID=71139 RepID=UPI00192EA067|nr:psbP domain-containing protein 1, chloroplastic isoform X1 [Eucalyptus grandis]